MTRAKRIIRVTFAKESFHIAEVFTKIRTLVQRWVKCEDTGLVEGRVQETRLTTAAHAKCVPGLVWA